MNSFDQRHDILDRRLRKDAMAKIENMTVALTGEIENMFGLPTQLFRPREQCNRIQVSHDGSIMTDPIPRLVKPNAPVDADDITTGVTHELE